MKCLGVFNNDVSATIQIYSFTKCGFYLFGNSIGIKNGRTVSVVRNNFFFFRRNTLDITFGITIQRFIVDDNAVEICIE